MATFLEIHSPKPPTQCVPTTFSWDGGIAPYTLKITAVTGDSQLGDVLQTFSGIGEQSLQWPVNLAGGTEFGVVLSDSTPITVQFVPVTVQAGPDSSCLGGGSSSSSSSTADLSTFSSTTTPTSSSSNPQPTETPTGVLSGSSISTSTISSESSTSSSPGPTGLPGAVVANTGKSLSGGAIAGIAIGGALAGIVIAVLFYWLWRRFGRRRSGSPRNLDLNESSLPPVQPPPTSKAAEAEAMRQSMLYGSPLSSPSPTTASFAQDPSRASGAYTEPSVYTPTPRTSRTPSASHHSAALSLSPQLQGRRLSVVNSTDGAGTTTTGRSSKALGAQVVSWAGSSSGVSSVQESDAGVRLAGGPPLSLPPIMVTEASESGSLPEPEGVPIPPPYRRYED
ncbi:hypothetical protein K466DRAFT_600900 [Polyporus arcularius HHB13444]|uniref:Mid2 domain-containing protein n=1 Tax=Polyporus arcularius HHB13444 TaxID=1314778 RepID=A0A5C3PAU7_9APHY|nr:hypothetical protein K466DRAFT_600900 [Polyporus arcularius HHB13444]